MDQSDAKGRCFDALRLTVQAQAEVLAQLKKQQGSSGSERRIEHRYQYQVQSGVLVKVNHPGGSTVTYVVQVRNLSNTGIAFLHGSFLYLGTRCAMVLTTTDGKGVRIEGAVARCEHVRGRVHDVGVRFSVPIQAAGFVTNSQPLVALEQSTELPTLAGKVLYVDDAVSDQELIKFQLGAIGVEVDAVSTGAAAVSAVDTTKYDAVLTGVWMPGMSGGELAERLHKKQFAGPIIALTSDERSEAKAEALDRGCSALLLKPFKFEALATLLAKSLTVLQAGPADQTPALTSKLWANEALRPLIRTFLARLETQVAEITRCVKAPGAVESLQKLCLDIKGSAGGYGFPTISQSAQRLLKLSADAAALDSLKTEIDALARLCRSACENAADGATATAVAPPARPLATAKAS